MSWIYFFEDKLEDRQLVKSWLETHLDSPVNSSSKLPEFSRWLAGYGADLPALLVLDLYQEEAFGKKSPERTKAFVRELRADARTRHLPVVLLTAAAEKDEGASAYRDLGVAAFFSKLDVFRRTKTQKKTTIHQEKSPVLKEQLLNLLARGRLTLASARLQRQPLRRGCAVFETEAPFRLMGGTIDALSFLEKCFQLTPSAHAPPELFPLLSGSGSGLLPLPRHHRNVIAGIDPDRRGSLLLSFHDDYSPPYVQAIGPVILRELFDASYRREIRRLLEEEHHYAKGFPEDKFTKVLEGTQGYYLALKLLEKEDLAKMSAGETTVAARVVQREKFLGYVGRYDWVQTPKKIRAVQGALNAKSMHLNKDVKLMVAAVKELVAAYPLVESAT